MAALTFLCLRQSLVTAELNSRLKALGLWNAFNPSIAEVTGGVAICFRAGRWCGDKPFRAYFSPPAGHGQLIDLTSEFKKFGIEPISDPKLFKLQQEVWVTFNTGHFEHPNRIFIARLLPTLLPPHELIVPGRRQIEKNWAVIRRDGVFHIVYSVCPLVVLRQKESPSNSRIVFEKLNQSDSSSPAAGTSLSLGTQLVPISSDEREFAVVMHKKIYWRKKRAYLGLVARIKWEDQKYCVSLSQHYLAHSPISLLGGKVRHNPNLLSCTYFAGLVIWGGRALLSYGINDEAAGFAELSAKELGLAGQRPSN